MTSAARPLRPDHLLDLTEWSALDEETHRWAELVEGVLIMAPAPIVRHQIVVTGLIVALHDALRPTWRVVPDVEVVVDATYPPTVRVPDVVVLAPAAVERPRLDPFDVLAVFEVLSPGTRRTDRVAKLAEYAEAGIAHYGIVDPGPPVTLTEFTLHDGRYHQVAEHRGTAELAIGVTLDLDALR